MFSKRSFVLVGMAALVWLATGIAAQEKEKPGKSDVKAQERPKLPDGVIHVALPPPGELRMENIARKGKPLIRLTVDKTVIEARTMFLGDRKGSPEAVNPSVPARVPPEEIEKLVKQLGSENANTRQAATKAILKIGDDALPHLGVVLRGTPSLELKRRAEALYAEISDKAPSPKLADGVIHVRLPPGTFDMKPVKLNGKPMIRITVGKTIIETQRFFFGDRWGCTQFEAIDDIIHWMPPKGGMGDTLAGMSKEPGAGYFSQSYVSLDQLKRGNLLVTSPSFVFRWGKDAKPRVAPRPAAPDKEQHNKGREKPKEGAKDLQLPEGVIHVALPPGEVRMENIVRNGKPLIRVTVDKTVIEARSMFFGNAKGATHYEAIKEGIHWAPASGGKGGVIDGVKFIVPGNTIGDPDFHHLEKLKAGSLFMTTPSIRFLFGPEAKAK